MRDDTHVRRRANNMARRAKRRLQRVKVRPFFSRIGRPGGAGRRVPRGSRWSPSTRPGARNRGSSPCSRRARCGARRARGGGCGWKTRAGRRRGRLPERGRPLSRRPLERARRAPRRRGPLGGIPALGAAVASAAPRFPRPPPRSRRGRRLVRRPPPRPRRGPRVGRRSAPEARGSRASTARGPARAPKRRLFGTRDDASPDRAAWRRHDMPSHCSAEGARAARRASQRRRSREPRAKTIATVTTPLPPLPPLPPLRVCPPRPRSMPFATPAGSSRSSDAPSPWDAAPLPLLERAPPVAGLGGPSGGPRAHLRSPSTSCAIALLDTDSTRGVGTTRWRRPRRSAPGGAEAGTAAPRSSPRGRRPSEGAREGERGGGDQSGQGEKDPSERRRTRRKRRARDASDARRVGAGNSVGLSTS